MTLRSWLQARTPAPPARLLARVEESLGASLDAGIEETPELCIVAAERLLAELLARESSGRESALDLLTVDALVTYALEAAAASPETLASFSASATARLAAVAR